MQGSTSPGNARRMDVETAPGPWIGIWRLLKNKDPGASRPLSGVAFINKVYFVNWTMKNYD